MSMRRVAPRVEYGAGGNRGYWLEREWVPPRRRPRRLLVALCAASLTLCLLAWNSAAAGADYSDHGTPDVSMPTASTHPSTYTPGGLADTGTDVTGLIPWALLAVAFGAALLLASGRSQTVRNRRKRGAL